MSKLEPLDPELATLLARETIPQPTADAAARVRHRVEASAATLGFVDAGVDAKPTATWPARRAFGLAGLTFVVGAALGAVTMLPIPKSQPQVVYVEQPLASVVVPIASRAPVVQPPLITPAVPEAHATAPSAVRRSDVDTLGAERALIEDAREKLARGEARDALTKLDEHAHRFPNARLSEEREALAIQALVNAGRHEEAKARATAFRAKWATSVYAPAVDVTIQSIP